VAYTDPTTVRAMISETELEELTSDGQEADDTLIAEAIGKADAEIDVYVGMVAEVPVVPTPDVLASLSVDMAIYHLFSRRSFMVDIRRQKYEDAIALLRLIAGGKVQLIPVAARESTVEFDSDTRVFSRTNQEMW
jgi:phage gp36-like protein